MYYLPPPLPPSPCVVFLVLTPPLLLTHLGFLLWNNLFIWFFKVKIKIFSRLPPFRIFKKTRLLVFNRNLSCYFFLSSLSSKFVFPQFCQFFKIYCLKQFILPSARFVPNFHELKNLLKDWNILKKILNKKLLAVFFFPAEFKFSISVIGLDWGV